MIKVMIVEDDPMVAALNEKYVQQMEGFHLCCTAPNTDRALDELKQTDIDLILLDVYMPGMNGLEFLKKLREQAQDIDVILITAASDINQIQQAMRLGAVDYLIKPFEFDRFQKALTEYRTNHHTLKQSDTISQHELDQLLQKKSAQQVEHQLPKDLPKGLTKNTLTRIHEVIMKRKDDAFKTDEIAEDTDISRVSIRKYLKFLTDIGYLDETLVYGVGRPIYQYHLNPTQQQNIDRYL
ncbi:response regulator [Thalassobacillus hwangdonensis]|uniref:Response regulator n=1 Tax=Thalassobacillus hwangdonensis TaxID=546108 RepID=A0ABW3L2P8_9BACI